MEKIIIYGAGGYSKVVISLLRLLGWNIVGLIDDRVPDGTVVSGVRVLGNASVLPELRAQGIRHVVNAVGKIGNQAIRGKIFGQMKDLDFDFPTLIHPAATADHSLVLSDGIQILAKSSIGPDCSIGFGTLINPGTIISRDVTVGACVNLYPGVIISADTIIDDFVQIGPGARILENVKIGSGSFIGSCAVVESNVPAGSVVPAGSHW